MMEKKIRVWKISYDEEDITISYGVKDGNLITKKVTERIYGSTLKTAEKLIKKRVNKGYRLNLNEVIGVIKTDIHDRRKPMLAKPSLKNIIYPAVIQPKYNGERCIASFENVRKDDGLFTVTNKEVVLRTKEGNLFCMNRIQAFLNNIAKSLFDYEEPIEFDGELYVHGERKGYVRKSCPLWIRNAPSNPSGNPNRVTYVIYDLIIAKAEQANRFEMLDNLVKANGLIQHLSHKALTENWPIHISRKQIVNSETEAIEIAQGYKQEGFEGGIVRNLHAEYQFGKRSWDLAKIKFKNVEVCTITDITPKPNEPETGIFHMRTASGDSFKGNPTGGFETRRDYLDNKYSYIGRLAKVTYFEKDIGNVPSHITNIEII